MASQNIARLGVVLGIDTAEFQAGVDKAIAENKKLKSSIQRESNAAAKEILALKYATEDYGKSVSKVTEVQREIAAGKYSNATEQMKAALLQQAAAYDKVVGAQKKTQQSTIKTFQINQQQLAALGYQTTDIVTGLVSGQNPLLVLIQQGGQLRDQFGGFGNLMKGIASQITVARVAFVGIAGAVGTLALAFYKGSDAFKEFQNNLILTNNIAGVTYDQVRNVAKVLSADFNTTVGDARDILNALVGSGKFTSESMYSVSEAIARVSKLTGQAADQVARDLIPAFDGSVSSAKRLNEQYNFLTLEQYKQVELLSMQGQSQKAAALTADLLTESLSKQNREVGFLEKAYNALKQSFSSFWNGLKEIGTPLTDEQNLVQLARGIEQLQKAMNATNSANMKKEYQAQIEDSIRRASELSLKIGQENAKRIVEAEATARQKANIDRYAAAGGKSKERSLNAEIEKNAIKASIEEFRRGVDERARIELDAQEQMLLVISEMNKRNLQENNVFQSQNAKLLEQELLRIYADMEEKKAEISRQAAKEVRERQATEQASIDTEREKLEIYQRNIFATQTELDIALSRLAVEKEIARIMRDTRLSPEAKEAAIERQKQIGANREEVIKLGDQLGRLKDINQAVWQNMANALENFVRTGKLNFKDLAKSIIQDLIAIQIKAQAVQLFRTGMNALGFGQAGSAAGTMALGGGFADGGNPPVGIPSIVGERGPELFVPRTAGTIVPNNKLQDALGGPQVVYNGPYIANMSAIDTQSAQQFLAKNKESVWAANQSASRGFPTSR